MNYASKLIQALIAESLRLHDALLWDMALLNNSESFCFTILALAENACNPRHTVFLRDLTA